MNSGRNHCLNTSSIRLQPKNFADYLSDQQDYALFLDIDGTLAEFTIDPKHSFIPQSILTLLRQIQKCNVKVAIVSGRSLSEARQMLLHIRLPIAATHGLEIAFDNYANNVINNDNSINSTTHIDTQALASIKQTVIDACITYPNFLIEDKPYSIALHYRQNPDLADIAYYIVKKIIKNYDNWMLKQGKYVWEIVPKGADKGTAILTLLEQMQTVNELYPIFIGDDITDEAGFSAVQDEFKIGQNKLSTNETIENNHKPLHDNSIKGMGIRVGSEPTCAHYYVQSIEEVTVLLESFLAYSQRRVDLSLALKSGEQTKLKKILRSSR